MKTINLLRLIICVTIIISLFSNPTSVYACSCMIPGTPSESFSQYDAIFIGRVIKTTFLQNIILSLFDIGLSKIGIKSSIDTDEKRYWGHDVTFTVSKSWKFVNTSSVEVTTGYGGGDCGYPFIIGIEYLVYANHAYGEPANYLVTSSCGRNAILSNAEEDLAFLRTVESIKLSLNLLQVLSMIIFISFVILGVSIYWRNKSKGI